MAPCAKAGNARNPKYAKMTGSNNLWKSLFGAELQSCQKIFSNTLRKIFPWSKGPSFFPRPLYPSEISTSDRFISRLRSPFAYPRAFLDNTLSCGSWQQKLYYVILFHLWNRFEISFSSSNS